MKELTTETKLKIVGILCENKLKQAEYVNERKRILDAVDPDDEHGKNSAQLFYDVSVSLLDDYTKVFEEFIHAI